MGFKKYAACFTGIALFLFIGWCGAVPVFPARAAPAEKKQPGLHYIFAHQYLPRILFGDPQLGLGLALRYDRSKMLETMWNHCRKSASETQKNDEPTGLAVTGGTVGSGIAVAVITMPPPKDMADAYYVCVVTAFTPGPDGTPRAGNVAYYTLEKTFSLSQITDRKPTGTTEPAPTILGQWDKRGNHANFGPGPAPDSPDAFVSAALKMHSQGFR